jgi:hypothetical protein
MDTKLNIKYEKLRRDAEKSPTAMTTASRSVRSYFTDMKHRFKDHKSCETLISKDKKST